MSKANGGAGSPPTDQAGEGKGDGGDGASDDAEEAAVLQRASKDRDRRDETPTAPPIPIPPAGVYSGLGKLDHDFRSDFR